MICQDTVPLLPIGAAKGASVEPMNSTTWLALPVPGPADRMPSVTDSNETASVAEMKKSKKGSPPAPMTTFEKVNGPLATTVVVTPAPQLYFPGARGAEPSRTAVDMADTV